MKAKHKHQYNLFLIQLSKFPSHYELMKRCSICGKIKQPDFITCLGMREDGTYKWLSQLEDFTSVYGELPILYNVEDPRYI